MSDPKALALEVAAERVRAALNEMRGLADYLHDLPTDERSAVIKATRALTRALPRTSQKEQSA